MLKLAGPVIRTLYILCHLNHYNSVYIYSGELTQPFLKDTIGIDLTHIENYSWNFVKWEKKIMKVYVIAHIKTHLSLDVDIYNK